MQKSNLIKYFIQSFNIFFSLIGNQLQHSIAHIDVDDNNDVYGFFV